jgi:regulator of protease activity HflC (stomatin/prohibitin superfamily)
MFKTGGYLVGAILILIFITCCMCLTTIGAGYVGVVYNTNGGVEEKTLSQGWHIMSPWQHVTEYPVSTETVYLSKDTKEGSKEDDSINVGTADGKPVSVDVSYTYHFEPTKLQHVFNKFRGQEAKAIADTYIRRFVKDNMNAVSTQYGIFDIYGGKRPEVAMKAYKMLSESLLPDGILIEGLSIVDVRPDEATKQAIQAKVNAIQGLQQIEVEKSRSVIEAEKKKIDADGEATKKRIEADAVAYSNAKIQASATTQVIALEWIKKWDGKVSAVQSGNGNSMVQIPPEVLNALSPAK